MNNNTKDWLPWLRGESLAIVLVTRRDDIALERRRDTLGPDLLLHLPKGKRPTGRLLGVEVRGALEDPPCRKRPKGCAIELSAKERARFADAPFPVCLFFFNVKTDDGYFGWICEPLPVEDPSVSVVFNPHPALQPLDDEQFDRIVRRVHAWYDARKTAAVKA